MSQKSVGDTKTELAQIMTPNEANVLGNVFGGAILSLIDLTASATAQKFSGHACVTAAFERVDFREPIELGELVTLTGHVAYVGRSSMEIIIEVCATNLRNGKSRQTNRARVTMVAIKDGKTAEVPRLVCETDADRLQYLEGKLRRETRQTRLVELEALERKLRTFSPDRLEELVTSEAPLLPQIGD